MARPLKSGWPTHSSISRSVPEPPHPRVPWKEALASARPGQRYLIEEVVYDAVRRHLRRLGYADGDQLICMENDGDGVRVAGDDARWAVVKREYAWFVRVSTVGQGMWSAHF